MATIGLDKLYYAPITEDANGDETYGTPGYDLYHVFGFGHPV